jgi:hypothetical protein
MMFKLRVAIRVECPLHNETKRKTLTASKFQLEEEYKCEVKLVGSHKRSHFEAITRLRAKCVNMHLKICPAKVLWYFQ